MTALLTLDRLSARFDGRTVLHNLNLEVPEGAFVTLLGPSGCGKSTTLRLIAGFGQPDDGRVLIRGTDVTARPAEARPTNMVFQDYALFPHLSVAENIGFGLRRMGVPRAQTATRVAELLELVRLAEFGPRAPQTLSGGQRQRVALARALARDPALLLLDEPLAALDAQLRDYMQGELKSLQRQTGKGFIFVTHDQDEALAMSDLVVVMNEGRIEQIASPEEIWARPASRFVAGFIGRCNLIEGHVLGHDGAETVLETESGRLRVAAAGNLRPGQAATMVIRAGKLRLIGQGRTTSAENRLEGHLVQKHFRGTHSTLEIRLGTEALIRLDSSDSAISGVSPGDAVTFGWEAADASLVI